MSLRNSDPPGGWGSHRPPPPPPPPRSGSSLASRGSRGRQRRADPPASPNDAYTPRVHDSGSVGNISDGSPDPRPYPPPPVRSNSRPVRSSSQSVHSSGGASVAGISGAPSRFRAPPGLAPVDTDAPRRPTSAIRIYVHARGTPAEGTDFAYYFEDHTDARVSTLHTLLSEGGLTRFSRAYEGVGSFEMCKASFGQGVTHVDNVSLLPPSRTSDELLSVRATPVPEVSYRGGRGPTASVVSLPSPTRNVPKFVPEDPSGGLDLGGGMDPGGSRPFSVPVVEDDASMSSIESDLGWSIYRPFGTSALRPSRPVRRGEASTGNTGPGGAAPDPSTGRHGVTQLGFDRPFEVPGGGNNRCGVAASDLGLPTEGSGGTNIHHGVVDSGNEEDKQLIVRLQQENARLSERLLGMEDRLAASLREVGDRAAADRKRHEEAIAAEGKRYEEERQRYEEERQRHEEAMRAMMENVAKLASGQAQPVPSSPVIVDSPSSAAAASSSPVVAQNVSPSPAQEIFTSRDLTVSLDTVPLFEKGDLTKEEQFFTSVQMLLSTHSSYAVGGDGRLVTTASNKGASGRLASLLHARFMHNPDVYADLKGEPAKTYVTKLLGFELLAWAMEKYGIKTKGVDLFNYLVKLFTADQGTNSLSVYVGDLLGSRNALQAGGLVIPDIMMVLFFLQGLADRYGAIKQDFALNQDNYMSYSLDDLQKKAKGFKDGMNFFAGGICPPAPAASNARTLRSRLPRPPGISGLSHDMKALLERNLSGRDCLFCGDERHGLLIKPCKELLQRNIVVKRDPKEAKRQLEEVSKVVKKSGADGAAIRASAALVEDGILDGYDDDEFQPDT